MVMRGEFPGGSNHLVTDKEVGFGNPHALLDAVAIMQMIPKSSAIRGSIQSAICTKETTSGQ